MDKYKGTCTHCGKKRTYRLTGFESQETCKVCKKELNTKFDFRKKTVVLY